MTDYNIAV